jgi:hypothetical protein
MKAKNAPYFHAQGEAISEASSVLGVASPFVFKTNQII